MRGRPAVAGGRLAGVFNWSRVRTGLCHCARRQEPGCGLASDLLKASPCTAENIVVLFFYSPPCLNILHPSQNKYSCKYPCLMFNRPFYLKNL